MATATQSRLRPPGPKNPPIIGQYPQFRKDAPCFLLQTARQYGDLAYFKLGKQNVYLLSHPDYVRDVLITNQHSFIKSRMLQRSKVLLGEGLLTSEAPLHTRQRRLVQPAFHRERLSGYGETMVAYAARTRDQWRDGETLDIAAEMTRLTLAVVAKTLFNADVEAEAHEIGEALTAILHLFEIVMMPFSELLEKLPVPSVRRFRRAKIRLDETIYRIINDRRRSGEDRGDLLSMLLLAQDEEGTGGMTDEQVRDESLTLFLAGHETTANALTWTWYLLSQHPQVEERFHQEIDRVLNGRMPSPSDFARLSYVEMVFAESLRLFPPAWAIGRMAKKDYEVGGYTIEPGSIVMTSPYVVHRDPRFYPEPERFDPERWTAERKAARPKFAFFPFGGGSRVCIGEHFAWMEGVLMLATLGQRWRLRLQPGHPVDHRALITLRPKHGMRMTLQKREEVSAN
jgi:cytochrome P450